MLRGQRIEFFTGSAEDIVIPLSDAEGDPVADLAGWTGCLEVRYAAGHPDVLVAWSTDPDDALPLMVLAESAARLKVDAALAAASLSWPWRMARWDLVLTAPAAMGGLPARPIRGWFRVVQGITR